MKKSEDEGVLLFVDELEEDEAWLLVGETRHRVPRAILPPEAREGDWLRVSPAQAPPEAQELERRRERLLRADSGGKIKL
jgi:hypothetical protein